jgi:ribosomal protein L34E
MFLWIKCPICNKRLNGINNYTSHRMMHNRDEEDKRIRKALRR